MHGSLFWLKGLSKRFLKNNERKHKGLYIYIYSHPQTDCFDVLQLFSAARPTRCFKLGSKPCWLYINQTSYARAIIILNVSEGNFYIFLHIHHWLPGVLNSWEELLHFSVCSSWRIFPLLCSTHGSDLFHQGKFCNVFSLNGSVIYCKWINKK